MSLGVTPGAIVWVPDKDDLWKAGEVLTLNSDSIHVLCDGIEIELPIDTELPLRDKDQYDVHGLNVPDDLTQLVHLNVPSVLHSLQARYDLDRIYTWSGKVLIAINPYKVIPDLYSQAKLQAAIKGSHPSIPHVFEVASSAFAAAKSTGNSQTILISGDSGAGKTETTKFCMRVLTACAPGSNQVEKRVLNSNAVLESFGNSRTSRNWNSSRFGKFIRLIFDENFNLKGGRISQYLLEKVRVTMGTEANFHIFSQLLKAYKTYGHQFSLGGAEIDLVPEIPTDLSSHKFTLGESSPEILNAPDHGETWRAATLNDTIQGMSVLGFSNEDINFFLNAVLAVLAFGDLEFDTKGEGCVIKPRKDYNPVRVISTIIGLPEEMIEKLSTCKIIKTATEQFFIPLTPSQAIAQCSAIARHLYSTLFDALVVRINMGLCDSTVTQSDSPAALGYLETQVPDSDGTFVGILDIFGFESFNINSLEQLCINYANEKLQAVYNKFVFQSEETLYFNENVPWDPVDFPDNVVNLDILEKVPNGVLSVLHDESSLYATRRDTANSSDQNWDQKLVDKFVEVPGLLDKPKMSREKFVVKHFAGSVEYCSTGFVAKNAETLSEGILSLLSSVGWTGKSHKARQTSAIRTFRSDLEGLITLINTTDPHFIRCIQSNAQQAPDRFARDVVLLRLRYAGVIETIEVSRKGYPIRLAHSDFRIQYFAPFCYSICHNYKDIFPQEYLIKLRGLNDREANHSLLLSALNIMHWRDSEFAEFLAKKTPDVFLLPRKPFSIEQLEDSIRNKVKQGVHLPFAAGLHTVFCRDYFFSRLEALRVSISENAAIFLQKNIRSAIVRSQVFRFRVALTTSQEIIKANICARAVKEFRLHRQLDIVAATLLTWVYRRRYMKKRAAIITFQSNLRRCMAVKELKRRKKERCAILIQSFWKGAITRKKYKILKAGVLELNRRLRVLYARAVAATDKNTEESQAREAALAAREAALAVREATLLENIGTSDEAANIVDAPVNDEHVKLLDELATIRAQFTEYKDTSGEIYSENHELRNKLNKLEQEFELYKSQEQKYLEKQVPAIPVSRGIDILTQENDNESITSTNLISRKRTQFFSNCVLRSFGVVSVYSLQLPQNVMESVWEKFNIHDADEWMTLVRTPGNWECSLPCSIESWTNIIKNDTEQLRHVMLERFCGTLLNGSESVGDDGTLTLRSVQDVADDLSATGDPIVTAVAQYAHNVLAGDIHDIWPELAASVAEGISVEDGVAYFIDVPMAVEYCDSTNKKYRHRAVQIQVNNENLEPAYLALQQRYNTLRLRMSEVTGIDSEADQPQVQYSKPSDQIDKVSEYKSKPTEYINKTPKQSTQVIDEVKEKVTEVSNTVEEDEYPARRRRGPVKQDDIDHGLFSALKNMLFGDDRTIRKRSTTSIPGPLVESIQSKTLPPMLGKRNACDLVLPILAVEDPQKRAVTRLLFQDLPESSTQVLLVGNAVGDISLYDIHPGTEDQNHTTDIASSNLYKDRTTPPIDTVKLRYIRSVFPSLPIVNIALGSSNTQIIVVSESPQIKVLNLMTGSEVMSVRNTDLVQAMGVMPEYDDIVAVSDARRILRFVNITEQSTAGKIRLTAVVQALAFSPSGNRLLCACRDGVVHYVMPEMTLEKPGKKQVRMMFLCHGVVTRGTIFWITFAQLRHRSDLETGYIANGMDGVLMIAEITTHRGRFVMNVVRRITFSPDTSPIPHVVSYHAAGFILCGAENNAIGVVPLHETGHSKARVEMYLTAHGVPVTCLGLNEPNSLLASGDELGNILLWRRFGQQ